MLASRMREEESSFQKPSPPASPKSRKKDLPPLFWYMETSDWDKATERLASHPKECKTWATLRTKSTSSDSTTKRLALHHACFKLRSAGALPACEMDPFLKVCDFILQLIDIYPEAAQKRETRHGCLPLHLASFASCAPRPENEQTTTTVLSRPVAVSKRSSSDATNETNMSNVLHEEIYAGAMQHIAKHKAPPNVSVSMRTNTFMSIKREEKLVLVLNKLLDAHPKAARVDSEGGRLPLHTACAGRATPKVICVLMNAYPAAARQRNKDGFLPLHLAAHWGVSHISVAIQLLKSYPDATVGRNRWERTPLEEALCMAGENGRPHQAALVRALRKHPTYWSRPPLPEYHHRPPAQPKDIVDIDESLPSNDTGSTYEEQLKLHQQRLYEGFDDIVDDGEESSDDEDDGEEVVLPPSPSVSPNAGLMKRLSPRGFMKNKKDGVFANPLGVGISMAHLIERRQWKIVLARIKQDPLEAEQELQVMTRGGFMASTGMSPLHYACERKPPPEVIKRLVEAYPFATMTRAMPGGCLPLHIACTWGASIDAIKVLLNADSGSVRVKDELGNASIHSACFAGAHIQILEALIRSDTKSILSRNHQGSRPIDIVKRLRHENRDAAMALLTKKKEELMRRHGRSRSSGLLSDIARQAEEMNAREMPEEGPGVEVTYNGKKKSQPLLWI